MLPWEGCRDAGRTGGMPGNPCSCRPPPAAPQLSAGSSGSARCLLPPSPPAPLPPALMSSGMLSNPCPICLQQGQRLCPKSGSPCPGNPPRTQRGQQDTTTEMPTRTGSPGLMVSPSTHPPSPVCCSPTEKGNTGTELLQAAFPVGPPSQIPFCLFIGKLYRIKKAKAALGSSDSRGVQLSFRSTKIKIKIIQDNAEELFVPV